MMARGWAIENNAGKIMTDTVSDSELSSKVKFLQDHCHFSPVDFESDAAVNSLFIEHGHNQHYTVIQVSVFPKRQGQVFDAASEKRELIDKLSDDYLYRMWQKHSGYRAQVDGNVYVAIDEEKFYPFIRQLMKESAGIA